MKTIRNLFSLLLALALMLSLAVPAMADETTYTISINGEKSGHTYEAYQLFSGSLDTTGVILSNITWGTGINGDAFLADLKASNDFPGGDEVANVFSACATAHDVATVLAQYTDGDKFVDKVAKLAGKHLTNATGNFTASGTSYTISGLPAGYYLVKDVESTTKLQDDFYTKFLLEVAGNVEVTVKGDVPTVEKKIVEGNSRVDETSTSIGETIYFELTATLPSNFEDYDSYFFTFTDTMSKGLDFIKIEDVFVQYASSTATIPANFVDFDLTTEGVQDKDQIKWTAAEDDGKSFQVKVGNIRAEGFPTLIAENKIVVRYSAKLNNDAVIAADGNPNEVKLNYSNNPHSDSEGTTGPDEVVVFTFGVDVDKHDKADSTQKLTGAEFVLYRREVYKVDNVEKLKLHFVVAENGKFKEWLTVDGIAPGTTTAQTWKNIVDKLTAEQMQKITMTTDANGEIKVAGLGIHTYRLLETKAPDGYNLPQDPFQITMTPTQDAEGNYTMSYSYENGNAVVPEDGFAVASVANGKGNTLPSTGGMGTTLFYVIGGLMVAGAAVLLVTKKRMSEV